MSVEYVKKKKIQSILNKPVHEVFVSPFLVQQTVFSTARADWLAMVFVYLLLGY